MTCDYVIVGQTEDGVEHFIGCSYKGIDNWFTMKIKTLSFKMKSRYRKLYKKIYLKKLVSET